MDLGVKRGAIMRAPPKTVLAGIKTFFGLLPILRRSHLILEKLLVSFQKKIKKCIHFLKSANTI
jgi:hypothetical protein